MRSELSEHLKQFDGRKVLVVGDVGLDHYSYGISTRLCPEAPIPVFNSTREEDRPGLSGNVAVNVASLGGNVKLCSIVGDDTIGFNLLECLDQAKVQEVERLIGKTKDRSTTLKTRYYIDRHMLFRKDDEQTNPFPDEWMKNFNQGVQKEIEWADFVIVQDYAKGLINRDLMLRITHSGKPVLVDPSAKQDVWLYMGADYMKPNETEFKSLMTQINYIKTPQEFKGSLGLQGLIVTCGSKGMRLFTDGMEYSFPALKKDVYDVCGAGDTVSAVLALSLASGISLIDSVQIANVAASLVVSKFGTATVGLDELREALYGSRDQTPEG